MDSNKTDEGKKTPLAIIGGTGLYQVDGLEIQETVYPDTPWGKPSDEIAIASYEGLRVAFLPRHGKGHFLSPGLIPQKANIAALKMLGVEEIIAFSSVGSLKEEIAPRDFVLPDQIIDRTRHREDTFYSEGIVVHGSFGDPFDQSIAATLKQAIDKLGIPLHTGETLICMEGPTFSTRAESKLYKSWGAGIINMTVLPESKLAREMEIGYQMVCMSTDYDSWRESEGAVTADEIMAVVGSNTENAKRIIKEVLPLYAKRIAAGPIVSGFKDTIRFGVLTAPDKRPADVREKLNKLLPGSF